MLKALKDAKIVKRLRKTPLYCRIRQYFPMTEFGYVDDRNKLDEADVLLLDWPAQINKPKFGIVRDSGIYPNWTKFSRFLEKNSFEYGFYDIKAHDWIENANKYDVILGFFNSEFWHLQEMREKYYFLENFLGKITYPSPAHACLYEDKKLEAYIAKISDIPFADTYVSHDKEDAMRLVENLQYPIVSKIVPASGSLGVELVYSSAHARKIVEQAFSRNGRNTFYNSFKQKNYVYFQEYIPNDGYDIRIIVVGKWVFGYYRKVLDGDFRASGMHQEEYREVPVEPMMIGRQVYKIIKSPMLAVDMVLGLDGQYHIIEFSPTCQVDILDNLVIDGVPGVFVFDDEVSYHFEKKRYWLQDLMLTEFLLSDYLPNLKFEIEKPL